MFYSARRSRVWGRFAFSVTAIWVATAALATAQWATFVDETATRLSTTNAAILQSDPDEKDYAFGDLDQDGDLDLVIVRKEPFTTAGRRANVLLMNENGVLTDRTTLYATNSTVPGSAGFADLTNDRDVQLADFNGDGWLDIVTATTLSGAFPKYISHPRIYINLGNNGSGQWQGFIFDNENRVPTMPDEPRFCGVWAGDIDNDGDQDLYLGDYQQGGARAIDLNDRLWINDGLGFFTDQSATRMTTQMLESSFGMAVGIADMNGDGFLDIIKDDALNSPQAVSVSYNNPSNAGFFNLYKDEQGMAPYHVKTGDLNGDGKLDMVVSDDGADRYLLNTGNDANGAANFSRFTYSFSGGGGDDGFGGNNHIADLNNDGYPEAIICDVDVDIAGFGRRCHIYRNLGPSGVIAGTTTPMVVLQEQISGGAVAGIPLSVLQGTYEVAPMDIDGDGYRDLVIGTFTGTKVYRQVPPSGVVISFPNGLPTLVNPGQATTIRTRFAPINNTPLNPANATLHYSIAGGAYQTVQMTPVGGNDYDATLPAIFGCGTRVAFYVSITNAAGNTLFKDPAAAPVDNYVAVAATGTQVIYTDSFENGNNGWSVVNTALTAGAWQIAVPNGTSNLGQAAAPSTDAEAGAQFTQCWVTQNGVAGGTAGAADVDGGPTDLISPPFNFANSDGTINYSRWYYAGGTRTMQVHVSGDGINWVLVETVGAANNNQWIAKSFRVGDFITPTATTQVRFRVSDNPNTTVVEAGIDKVSVEKYTCYVCQPNLGYGGPGMMNVSVCGGDLSAGTTADLALTGALPNDVAYLTAQFTLDLAPVFGGTLASLNPIVVQQLSTNAAGEINLPGIIGGIGPLTLHVQFVQVDGNQAQLLAFSNIVSIVWP